MIDLAVIWDLEDDPEGNVQHLAEHGITVEEAEEVLRDPRSRTGRSRRTGRPQVFGSTSTGKYITVIWEEVLDNPRTTILSQPTKSPRPKGGSDESDRFQARIEPGAAGRRGGDSRPIENRAPWPDELIDRGELDELVPHVQYLEVRTLGAKMREIREGLGLSLTDVAERSGLTLCGRESPG